MEDGWLGPAPQAGACANESAPVGFGTAEQVCSWPKMCADASCVATWAMLNCEDQASKQLWHRSLLGDVSMVVMTLVLRNPDQEESLVPHRGLLLAICWKLFLLVEHADADVRNGATQNLKSLFSHTWFQKEAFGDSPLVFEVVSFCPATRPRPQPPHAADYNHLSSNLTTKNF